jgi:hypothetical protein
LQGDGFVAGGRRREWRRARKSSFTSNLDLICPVQPRCEKIRVPVFRIK